MAVAMSISETITTVTGMALIAMTTKKMMMYQLGHAVLYFEHVHTRETRTARKGLKT